MLTRPIARVGTINKSILTVYLIGTLVLPYGRAATCECHDHVVNAEHCSTDDTSAVAKVKLKHHCDAMMACCLVDFGRVLAAGVSIADTSDEDKYAATITTPHATADQAPPKPPPRV